MKGLCGPRPAPAPAATAGQVRAAREFMGAGPPDVTACKSPIGLMFPNLSTAGMKMSGNTGCKFKACGSPLQAAKPVRPSSAIMTFYPASPARIWRLSESLIVDDQDVRHGPNPWTQSLDPPLDPPLDLTRNDERYRIELVPNSKVAARISQVCPPPLPSKNEVEAGPLMHGQV